MPELWTPPLSSVCVLRAVVVVVVGGHMLCGEPAEEEKNTPFCKC